MPIEEHDGSTERRILIGAVVDSTFLGKVVTSWEDGLLRANWSNLLMSWCVDYYNKHGKAPLKNIEAVFDSWQKGAQNKDAIKQIESLLASLSGQYLRQRKDINSSCLIDLAGDYFNEVATEKAIETARGFLYRGKVGKAQKVLDGLRKINIGVGSWIDPLRDKEAQKRAFEQKSKPVFSYTGALGRFINPALHQDSLVGIMAPPGHGKSWLAMDMLWEALMERHKVAYFQVGDMSEAQVMMRLLARAAGKPIQPGLVKYPETLKVVDRTEIDINYKITKYNKPLSLELAQKSCDKIIRNTLRTDESLLRMAVYANFSVNVLQIRDMLRQWAKEGWLPRAIIIDYPDILQPPPGYKDKFEQVDVTWRYLRSISQEFHACLIVPTQSNTASFSVRTMSKKHFGESRMKLATATAMLAINMTDEEKDRQLWRLNTVKLREDRFVESHYVWVANCLPLAQMCVLSAK